MYVLLLLNKLGGIYRGICWDALLNNSYNSKTKTINVNDTPSASLASNGA
jgi:hypothetical protein